MSEEKQTSSLRGQTLWGLIGEVVLVVGGLVSFVTLTRFLLSKPDYALVSAIQAIAIPAYALAGMGAPFLLMRSLARSSDLNATWHRAVTTVAVGSVVVTAALILLRPWLLGRAPLVPFALLLISTGSLTVYHELYFSVAMALEKLQYGALARSIGVAARLGGLGVFALSEIHSFERWAWVVSIANFVATLLITAIVGRGLGLRPGFSNLSDVVAQARHGYGFAVNGASEGVLDASDRPVLLNAGFDIATAEYAVAARLVSFAGIPVLAVMRAITARLLREGKHGVSGSLAVTKRFLPLIAGLGAMAATATFVVAPLVTFVAGDKYLASVGILRWLAVVPAIKAVQFLAGNALDAGQRQLVRFWLTMAAALLNLGLNVVFIPRYSWRAAVGSTIAAELCLMVALWVALLVLSQREEPVDNLGAASA